MDEPHLPEINRKKDPAHRSGRVYGSLTLFPRSCFPLKERLCSTCHFSRLICPIHISQSAWECCILSSQQGSSSTHTRCCCPSADDPPHPDTTRKQDLHHRWCRSFSVSPVSDLHPACFQIACTGRRLRKRLDPVSELTSVFRCGSPPPRSS